MQNPNPNGNFKRINFYSDPTPPLPRPGQDGPSPLLRQFRANPMLNLELTDLGQHIIEFAQDQQGSRFIQQKLERAKIAELQLMQQAIKGHVVGLAMHKYGCRVIQKAVETVPAQGQLEIIRELCGGPQHLLKCATDRNGSHLVEKILKHCTMEQTRALLDQLNTHLLELVTDPYGNYVVQHAVVYGSQVDRERIVDCLLRGCLKNFAQDKFASNVVRKCLAYGSSDQRNALIDDVCMDNDSPNPPLLEMIKVPFANYVVQKMLHVAEGAHRAKLMFAIQKHMPALRTSNYGQHVINKLEMDVPIGSSAAGYGLDQSLQQFAPNARTSSGPNSAGLENDGPYQCVVPTTNNYQMHGQMPVNDNLCATCGNADHGWRPCPSRRV